jgi:hypothetical protein
MTQILAVGPCPAFPDHRLIDAVIFHSKDTDEAAIAIDVDDFECHGLAENLFFQRPLGCLAKRLSWQSAVWNFWGVDAVKPDLEFGSVCSKDRQGVSV